MSVLLRKKLMPPSVKRLSIRFKSGIEGQPCAEHPGATAAQTGCVPASGEGGKHNNSSQSPAPENKSSLPKPPKTEAEYSAWAEAISNLPQVKKVLTLLSTNRQSTMDVHFKNGEWDAARVKTVHEPIVRRFLNPRAAVPEGQTPKLILLIGPAGAGKTSVGSKYIAVAKEWTLVNPDEVASMLPEYAGWNATNLHQEASYLDSTVASMAMKNRHNVVYDGSGRDVNKMLELINTFKAKGYDAHVVHVTVPPHVAAARAAARFMVNPLGEDPKQPPSRWTPLKFVHDIVNGKPDETYRKLKESGLVKSGISFSNDVPHGENPKKLDSFGDDFE